MNWSVPPPAYGNANTRNRLDSAAPAGLAAREILRRHDVPVLVIDNQPAVGGQFLMQTHQFFWKRPLVFMQSPPKEKETAGNQREQEPFFLAGNGR